MKYALVVGVIILSMGITGMIKSYKDLKAISWIVFGIIMIIVAFLQMQ